MKCLKKIKTHSRWQNHGLLTTFVLHTEQQSFFTNHFF